MHLLLISALAGAAALLARLLPSGLVAHLHLDQLGVRSVSNRSRIHRAIVVSIAVVVILVAAHELNLAGVLIDAIKQMHGAR